jgi:hypothetical protein
MTEVRIGQIWHTKIGRRTYGQTFVIDAISEAGMVRCSPWMAGGQVSAEDALTPFEAHFSEFTAGQRFELLNDPLRDIR